MAQYVVNFDSVTKECSVTRDGEAVENVERIVFNKRYDEDGLTNKAHMFMGQVEPRQDGEHRFIHTEAEKK